MDTMIAVEPQVPDVRYTDAASRPSPRRHAAAATIVAGLYVLLVLGAPLIVRYGPDPETASVPAAVVVNEAATPRCASALEFGHSCQAGDPAVTPKALLPIVLH